MTATSDAKRLQVADGRLRVILPGTWIRIPLDDEAETTAFVKRLLKRRIGTNDRLARMRRQVMDEIVGTAKEAVNLGVHTYLMSMEILPGVPFPAAMLMLDIDWPEPALPVLREEGPAKALETAYPDAEFAEGYGGPMARRYEMVRQQLGEDGSEILTMRLEYYLPYPAGFPEKVLMIRANVPDIPHAEPFALLFNEIADSIVFPELDGTGQENKAGPAQEPQVTSA